MKVGRVVKDRLTSASFGHGVSPIESWVQENLARSFVYADDRFSGGETAQVVFGGATPLQFDASHSPDDTFPVYHDTLTFFDIVDIDWSLVCYDHFNVSGVFG